MERVILFGNNQMSSMIYFYLTHDSCFQVAAFTVNEIHIKGKLLFGLPVVPFEELEQRFPPSEYRMCIPISNRNVNHLREEKYSQAKIKGYKLITYISSKAITWPGLVAEDNCIILEGAIIQPFSTIGKNVFVACNSIVGHDCVIGDHCFLAPGAVTLGNVRVGSYCFLGANSTIRDGVQLGSECFIGAGVTISRNTGDRQVYIANEGVLLRKPSDELRKWLNWMR